MRKPLITALLAVVLLCTSFILAGCGGAQPKSTVTATPLAPVQQAEAGPDPAFEPSATSVPFTLDDAKEAFGALHPDAGITVAKLEGDVFYIEGWEDSLLYKMKFAVADGEVILDKMITTEHPF